MWQRRSWPVHHISPLTANTRLRTAQSWGQMRGLAPINPRVSSTLISDGGQIWIPSVQVPGEKAGNDRWPASQAPSWAGSHTTGPHRLLPATDLPCHVTNWGQMMLLPLITSKANCYHCLGHSCHIKRPVEKWHLCFDFERGM